MKSNRLIAGVLAASMLLLGGCGKAEEETEEDTTAVGTAVEVQTVSRADIATQSRLSGKVVPRNEVAIMPKISAKVLSVNVKVGDSVSKGQVLFSVDPSDIQKEIAPIQGERDRTAALYDAQISQAQQSLADTQTLMAENIRLAQQDVDNAKALLEYGATSSQELDKANVALTQAKLNAEQSIQQAQVAITQLQTAKANAVATYNKNISDLNDNIADTHVEATVSGTVTAVNIEQGGTASPQGAAVTVATNETPQIEVAVSEEVQPWLKQGDSAQVTLSAGGNQTFAATIATVAPSADAASKLYKVLLDIPSDVNVTYGMFAEVEFQTDTRSNTVLIPTESILTDSDSQYVYTVDGNNCAVYVPIQSGLIGEGVTEVTSGLNGGETLVTKGQSYLSDGAQVRIVTGEDNVTDNSTTDADTSAGLTPETEANA